MNYIIFFILCITIIYTFYVSIKYKQIPTSLSETSYLFGGNKKYLFTVYCAITAICLLPVLLELTTYLQFLPFIFCGGLLFAGCSPLFKTGLDKIVHYTWAVIAFSAYLCYMIFYMGWLWSMLYFIVLGILCCIKKMSYVYWAEMTALIEICIFVLCC